MNIKKRLQEYRHKTVELKQIKEKVEILKERTTSIRSSSDCSEVLAAGGNSDKIGELVANIVDLQNRYYEKMLEIIAEQKDIEQMIEQLDPVERLLMRARYFEGVSWEEVCLLIGYGWAQTHRLHSKSLSKLARQEQEAS